MRLDPPSYTFIVPTSLAAGSISRNIYVDILSGNSPLTSVKIELAYRRELNTDSPDTTELQNLNDLVNQHVISSVGDVIRETSDTVIKSTALVNIETTAAIYRGGTETATAAPTEATNINFTIFTKDPCPVGDCWMRDYSKGICIPKASCALVQCDHDTMFISFKSDLFGIDDGNQMNLRPNGELTTSSVPSWDTGTERWEIRCVLGTCGMDVSTKER